MRKALVIILGLALIGAVVYSFVITSERNALQTELDATKSELVLTRSELNVTKSELALTKSRLSSTEQSLASTQVELSSTKQMVASVQQSLDLTQAELSSTKQTLSSVQQSSAKLQDTLTATQKQLTVAQETLGGLGIALFESKECYDVVLVDNAAATNPTWSQLLAFLSQDRTDRNTYVYGVYDCSQFSRDVHNNAEKAGIRAAEVQIYLRGEPIGHALNAFLTTDYGLVYVDCTGGPDTIARVKAGKEYRAAEIHSITGNNVRNDYWWDALSFYYYIRSSTGGQAVTQGIRIYW